MKKFFDRLRRWLIKKLGGYTERYTPIRRDIVRERSVKTHTLVAKTTVRAEDLAGGAIDYKQYCESVLLDRIVVDLQQSGLILWESSEDIFRQEVNVRATVYVADANDMMPYTKCWVE